MTSERRSDKKKKKALIHDGRSSTIAMPSDIRKNPVHIPFRLDPIDCFPPICPRSAMNACIPMMAKFLKFLMATQRRRLPSVIDAFCNEVTIEGCKMKDLNNIPNTEKESNFGIVGGSDKDRPASSDFSRPFL